MKAPPMMAPWRVKEATRMAALWRAPSANTAAPTPSTAATEPRDTVEYSFRLRVRLKYPHFRLKLELRSFGSVYRCNGVTGSQSW